MILTFNPVRMDITLDASVSGNVLTLNGVALDFSPLPAGATLPCTAIVNPWIAGDVARAMDGTLTVPLILPHGANAPEETRFPEPITINSGAVPLPPHSVAEDEE
jgi:hypothetical protein